MVTIRESGIERRATAAGALLLHLTKRGIEGDGAAARASEGALSFLAHSSIAGWASVPPLRAVFNPQPIGDSAT
jgi:hypothetical protein